MLNWTRKKPKFNSKSKECILIAATKINERWEYTLFEMRKMEYEDKWYWGIITADGDEWGDYADLKAQLYYTMPLLKVN